MQEARLVCSRSAIFNLEIPRPTSSEFFRSENSFAVLSHNICDALLSDINTSLIISPRDNMYAVGVYNGLTTLHGDTAVVL